MKNLFISFFSQKIETKYESDSIIENEELKYVLSKAINSLTENQRIAFTLHKIDDISHKEIAELMGISVFAVESLIFKAKRILKNKIESISKKNKGNEQVFFN